LYDENDRSECVASCQNDANTRVILFKNENEKEIE
jgi:hypothetical protein